ncbi:phosphoglycerate kinase [bacterium]|nr:phosphoglycerate kinase [bacterium]|tara:strand:+ start:8865 stop:9965 length:1101 start_codon:yes stop_codon:yes gene_type:complete
MKCIDEENKLAGKVVLVRAGLNTPLHNGKVINDFRVRKALPTLQFLRAQGAKVIVIAHIGRHGSESLAGVAEILNERMPTKFSTRDEIDSSKMTEGEVVLLENLRQDPREVENDDGFARELAALADIFVQDAFSVCHREHASIVGIPRHIDSYAGLLLKAETTVLERVLRPERPALFVLGGSKFATKEPLIRKFIDVYDKIFVGGALQNEFLAARGIAVGRSVIEDGAVPSDLLVSDKMHAVVDVVVEHEDSTKANVPIDRVRHKDTIVDIGENTIASLSSELMRYKTILWNGPLGWYERGYDTATANLARAVVDSGAETIVGGGDTVAVIQKEGLEDRFDFVSTGGGAMLAFLLHKTLPGIEVLK